MNKLQINSPAPDFTAYDQNGKYHSLKDYHGKWLLLYFYPKDDTPGCTKEACSLRDNFDSLNKKITIVGVSADSINSHKKFAQKYKLPFILLSDTEKKMINDYGANGLIFPKRITFLINPRGIIKKIYAKVDPANHANQIEQDLSEVMKD